MGFLLIFLIGLIMVFIALDVERNFKKLREGNLAKGITLVLQTIIFILLIIIQYKVITKIL